MVRASCASPRQSSVRQQMLLEELGGVPLLPEDVFALRGAVSLIVVDVVAESTPRVRTRTTIWSLSPFGTPGGVRPLDHEQWGCDLVGIRDWQPEEQELTLGVRIADQLVVEAAPSHFHAHAGFKGQVGLLRNRLGRNSLQTRSDGVCGIAKQNAPNLQVPVL
jgi:hypothetical protein